MHVQPRLLTVIIANDDLAKTYTTIHSVAATRYRNHEVVCVVPYRHKTVRTHIAQDFKWLPLITDPLSSIATLLQECVGRARFSYANAILFVEAGTTMDKNTIHRLVDEMSSRQKFSIIMPSIVRADGSGIVSGATPKGRWPHQLVSILEFPEEGVIAQSHFVGGALLIRSTLCFKHPFGESADELALLYWMEHLLQSGARSISLREVAISFDGALYCDFSDMMLVPDSWYRDARRYIAAEGTWYDKLEFNMRFGWRKTSSPLARLADIVWQNRFLQKQRTIH